MLSSNNRYLKILPGIILSLAMEKVSATEYMIDQSGCLTTLWRKENIQQKMYLISTYELKKNRQTVQSIMICCLCWAFEIRKDLHLLLYNDNVSKNRMGISYRYHFCYYENCFYERIFVVACHRWLSHSLLFLKQIHSQTSGWTIHSDGWESERKHWQSNVVGAIILYACTTKTRNYMLLKLKKSMKMIMTCTFCSWHHIYHLILGPM